MDHGTAAVGQHVILVGGKGTRLGDKTLTTPKPLMPVGGRPFLDHLIARAAAQGAEEILLLAGHLGDQIVRRYDGGHEGGAAIRVLVEPSPMGTGGALTVARDHLRPRFAMSNGDSLFAVDIAALAATPDSGPWLGRLALRQRADTGRAGVVTLDGAVITAFLERGPGGPGLINGGVYVLDRGILDHIPDGPCSLEADIFPTLARRGLLQGVVVDGFFIDIGVPEDLARAQTEVPAFLAGQPVTPTGDLP